MCIGNSLTPRLARRLARASCLFLAVLVPLVGAVAPAHAGFGSGDAIARPPAANARSQAGDPAGTMSLRFEPNVGQVEPSVRFLSRGSGYALLLAADAATLVLVSEAAPPVVIRLRFLGAGPAPVVSGYVPAEGQVNYVLGTDPNQWWSGLPTFAGVRAADLYPGIDVLYHGEGGGLTYDLIVAPGADPAVIRLAIDGSDRLAIAVLGDLLLRTAAGEVRQSRPVLYQEVAGERRPVAGGFVLTGPHEVGFAVGDYDPSQPLVIDPTVAIAAYLGGNGADIGRGIAVDAGGNSYVIGETASTRFPTADGEPDWDVFVATLDATGSQSLYTTFLGGAGSDIGKGIAVDAAGHAYLVGETGSADFPTVNPIQADYAGGETDIFVAKLAPNGQSLVYSTFLGGFDCDRGNGIALAPDGTAQIVGYSRSPDFPTERPIQAGPGSPEDVVVAALTADGAALSFSTFLGGDGDDIGRAIAIDGDGHGYLTGETDSTDFPFGGGALGDQSDIDAFVVKLLDVIE